ncbi:MAG: hypothetical protein EXR35_03145 [Limnohabitans sp.]|nr:hypothetical protein [Limnohabitans sp.]
MKNRSQKASDFQSGFYEQRIAIQKETIEEIESSINQMLTNLNHPKSFKEMLTWTDQERVDEYIHCANLQKNDTRQGAVNKEWVLMIQDTVQKTQWEIEGSQNKIINIKNEQKQVKDTTK